MGDAFAFLCTGQWGEKFFDVVKDGRGHGDVLPQVRQLMYDGKISAWGKRHLSDLYVPIPPEYWRDHNVEWFSIFRDRGAQSGSYPGTDGGERYQDLMVCRQQIEKEFPLAEQS